MPFTNVLTCLLLLVDLLALWQLSLHAAKISASENRQLYIHSVQPLFPYTAQGAS